MRLASAIGLGILFVIGALLGVVIGALIVPVSLVRRARAVHADGVLCRAQIVARDPSAERLAGPALVRMSGALADQATTGSDVLGIAIRMQRVAVDDATQGDQDLLLGTFESFHTVSRDRAATNAGDYLANRYSTVTPWWLASYGPVKLHLEPPTENRGDAPGERSTDGKNRGADPGGDRLTRLDAALAADRARFVLTADTPAGPRPLAEVQLFARLALDGRTLRESMLRQGRGLRPLGLRNGIRATVYPMSQAARRLRGG
jgi:hypothetical protein